MHPQKALAQRRLSPNLLEKGDSVVEFRCFFTHCNYIKPEPLLHTLFRNDVVRPWSEVGGQIVIASNDDNKIDVVWRRFGSHKAAGQDKAAHDLRRPSFGDERFQLAEETRTPIAPLEGAEPGFHFLKGAFMHAQWKQAGGFKRWYWHSALVRLPDGSVYRFEAATA